MIPATDPAARDGAGCIARLAGVAYAIGGRPVFDGLDIEIARGKITAIMGPSGTGKTTLLRLITGQIRPTAGRIEVDGEDLGRLDTDGLYRLRQRMGMLFQNGALLTDLDVFENVAFPLREHTDLPEELIRRMVLMKLNAVGLRGASRLMPGDLSGGMTRRVALARAIATEPVLAMYDEPFAGLDPISLNVIADLVRRLNDALGTTSIVVTYDVSETLKLVDYIYVISEGTLAGHGTPAELLASEDPFLKQFLHALPDGPVPFHLAAKPMGEEFRLPEAVPGS